MYRLKKFIYGRKYGFYYRHDKVLECFDKSDYIEFDKINKNPIPDGFYDAIDFLIKEGLVEPIGHGVRITSKGKILRKTGGNLHVLFKDRFLFFSVIAGVIIGIIGIILAILSFVKD